MKSINTILAAIIISSMLSACGHDGAIPAVTLIPVRNGDDYQYIDREGKVVINPQFSEASVFREGKALVRTQGDNPKWGYIDEEGKYLINPQYKHATIFSEGLAWVVKENGAPSVIDEQGKVIFSLKEAQNVKIFKDGLAAFRALDEKGEIRWGFVNPKGEIVIKPKYMEVTEFSEGKCGVLTMEADWTFIDKSGKKITHLQFSTIDKFRNGRCLVYHDKSYGIIDEQGKFLLSNLQYDEMVVDGPKYLIRKGYTWGWLDQKGNILVKPQFSFALPYHGHNLAAVSVKNRYGFINHEGEMTINPQFDGALPFNGGLAMVTYAKKIGFINEDGKYVINPQFESVPEDLMTYYQDGGTEYHTLKSDYFNADVLEKIANDNEVYIEGIVEEEYAYDLTHGITVSVKTGKLAGKEILIKLYTEYEDIPGYEMSGDDEPYEGKKVSGTITSTFLATSSYYDGETYYSKAYVPRNLRFR